MKSLFERAVGDGWSELHLRLRERYGFTSADGVKAVASGDMAEIETSYLASPLLRLLSRDDFLFPCHEEDISYRVESHAFQDERGFEAVYIERRFDTTPPRRFVDTLYWNPERGTVTDVYGRNGRITSELRMTEEDGDLSITLGNQWLRTGGSYRRLHTPFNVSANLRDGFSREEDRYKVEARVRNPLLGEIYRYTGWFRHEFQESPADTPPEDAVEVERLP